MMPIIKAIEFGPGRHENDGLEECLLPDLDSIVVLSGRNGSGKTRIIRAIKATLAWATEQGASSGSDPNAYWKYWHDNRQTLRELSALNPSVLRRNQREALDRIKKEIANCPAFKFNPSLDPASIKIVELFPSREPTFPDPGELTENRRKEIRERLDNSESLPLETASALEYLDTIARDYRHSTYEVPIGGHERTRILSQRYERVARVLKDHLDLSPGFSGFDPTLNGMPLTVAAQRLSTGQKYLLDFWVRASSHSQFDEPTLILMDEPELHVHPAALVPVFSTIFDNWINAQLFVATHSVPLIARLGFERVLWVQRGRVERARNVIDQLLTALLGGDGAIEMLRHLTLEPDRLATLTFAAECLSPPNVLDGERSDPQANQFRFFLSQRYEDLGKPVRVIDWGAGKARLLRCLKYEEQFDVRGTLSYFALEREAAAAEVASVHIAEVYGLEEKRLFRNYDEAVAQCGPGYFDVCVVCNVLHEIHPDEWLNLFSEICSLLGDDGFLLLIEDGELPHGERAHRDGFLLLDAEAVQELFQLIDPADCVVATDAKYVQRLRAFAIPRKMIQPTRTSIANAIRSVRDTSWSRLEKIKTNGYRDGSLRSLHIEQFYNASRLLEQFRGELPPSTQAPPVLPLPLAK